MTRPPRVYIAKDIAASTPSALVRARASRAARLKDLRSRARLVPALTAYDVIVQELLNGGDGQPHALAFGKLTQIFRGSFAEVQEQIRVSGKIGIAATNSIKRSAGTNFQGLCEYAILSWLDTTDLPINVCPNAPKGMRDELTIYGVDTGGEFSVEPDIDICLWLEGGGADSPLIFVSAKSSLVDRAGQAARWKLYLDLHQTSCVHTATVHDCPIHRTRVKIKTQHPIEHCIVTANIYKIDTTQPHGELASGQCRNNTYMFRHKYTTRDDPAERRPTGWQGFAEFQALVRSTFRSKLPLVPSPT